MEYTLYDRLLPEYKTIIEASCYTHCAKIIVNHLKNHKYAGDVPYEAFFYLKSMLDIKVEPHLLFEDHEDYQNKMKLINQ